MEHAVLRIEIGHTYEEWLKLNEQDENLWDFPLSDMLDRSIEPRDDITYWLVQCARGYRLCEASN